jgi:hypothetical protein
MISILISGTWSNVYVFAQHSSLPWSASASLQQSSSSDYGGSNTPGWTTLTTAASKPLPTAPQQQLAINQEQQQEPQLLSNNGTEIQGYTSNSPVVAQDKLMYLGYHGGVSANNNDSPPTKTSTSTSDTDHSSSSKDKYNSHHTKGTIREDSIEHNKSPAHHSSSTTAIGKATSSKSETNYKDIKPCTPNKSFPKETLEPKNNRYSDCYDHRGEDRLFGRDTFFNADTFSDNGF